MKAGVYQIRNTITGFSYIGSSADVDRRVKEQRNNLKKKRCDNAHLQMDWDYYEESCFEFKVLLFCSIDSLFEMEQTLIDLHDCYNKGYNMYKVGGSVLGMKRSEKTKQKMRGNTNASGGKGRTHSVETKLKMSLAKKGRKGSGMSGKHHSNEAKLKMSLAKKGNSDSLVSDLSFLANN